MQEVGSFFPEGNFGGLPLMKGVGQLVLRNVGLECHLFSRVVETVAFLERVP